MATEPASLRASSARLDALLGDLDRHPDAAVRAGVREAVALLMDLHRAGLDQLLALAADPAAGGPGLLARFADDPAVGPLLLVHSLHPFAVDVRLTRALERLRPHLSARGCRAWLERVEQSTAIVRLECRAGDPSAVHDTVESCLVEAAPELTDVRIEAVTVEMPAAPAPALIQIMRKPETVR